MWCTCRYEGGVWYDLTGQTNNLQVCGKCRKPARAYLQKFTAMRCPKDAEALIHIFSRRDEINEVTFVCKGGVNKKVFFVGKNPDMLFELWKKIDYEVDQIKSGSLNPEYNKFRAGAFAEAISMIMPLTRDEVSAEALRRWEARQAGTDYETPGLAEEIYTPPVTFGNQKSTGNRIPDAAVNSSTQAIKLGMFTVAQIAKSYGMTEDEVKSQLGLA